MRYAFFATIACTLTIHIWAQSYNRDSVTGVVEQIRKTKLDTGHIRQLRDLAYEIGESDSTLSRQLLNEALQKSLQIKDGTAIANTYRMLGLWYKDMGKPDTALIYYWASLQVATKHELLYLMAGANFEISNIKYELGEYDSCIDYSLKTQELFENPKIFEYKTLTQRILDKKKSDLYSNMSSVFNTLKNLPRADEYIDKALAIAESYKNDKVIAFYTQQKADNFYENGQIERALRLRLKTIAKLENGAIQKSFLQTFYLKISNEYFELDKTDSAKLFAQKSLQTASELEVPDAMAHSYMQLGEIALKEKQYNLAEDYLKKCTAYFTQSNDPHEKRSFADMMRRLMFATGRYKEAYSYYETYHELNDRILKSERSKQFSDREAKYQSEKKDAQIKLQQSYIKQKNTLNYLLIGGAGALFLISILSWINFRSKQKLQQQRINELETEKKLAATEAVLKGEEQERTRLAKDLHDGLGGMLSGIKFSLNTMKGNLVMTPENAQAFERSMDMLDSSIKEMRRVAHNMMPEALVKFGLDTALKDVCTDINQSGALQVNYQSIGMQQVQINSVTASTIYRIVQELLNNTIKHASAKNAIVQLSKTDGILSVTVEDDGKGFDTAILKQTRGIGWDNIQNRVEFLKAKMDVDSSPGKGTSVHIEINM